MADPTVTFVKDSGYRRNRKRGWGVRTDAGAKWERDDNQFGLQSLKKLGWQEGKGLGSREQGITEHVKVKRLAEGKGLGGDRERTSDRWVANVTGFASVLHKLNAQYSAPVETAPASEAPVGDNDADNAADDDADAAGAKGSEFSQMGVMYKKRLKHKDMRSYSSNDLTAILGGVNTSSVAAQVVGCLVACCVHVAAPFQAPAAPPKPVPDAVACGMFVRASSHLTPDQGGHLISSIAEPRPQPVPAQQQQQDDDGEDNGEDDQPAQQRSDEQAKAKKKAKKKKDKKKKDKKSAKKKRKNNEDGD